MMPWLCGALQALESTSLGSTFRSTAQCSVAKGQLRWEEGCGDGASLGAQPGSDAPSALRHGA